jgi:hypothetical protein
MKGDFEYVYVFPKRDESLRASQALNETYSVRILRGTGFSWELHVSSALPRLAYEAFAASDSDGQGVSAVWRELERDWAGIDAVAVRFGGEYESSSFGMGE